MPKTNSRERDNMLKWARAIAMIFALLVAAAHLVYGASLGGSSFAAPTQTSNSVHTGPPAGGFGGFNEMGFWFDLEVVAYTVIAMVFLLGLRSWYLPASLFNIFNLGIYFLSGVTAIPGITGNAFPSRFNIMLGLSSINIIIAGWIVILILGLLLMKYDPGSRLDELLKTNKA